MIREALVGALAGLVATAPMTGAMNLGHRRLPWYQRYALPPRRITMNVAKTVGLRPHLDQKQKHWLTLVSHYGYGTAMGALFGALAATSSRRAQTSSVAKGVLFGLGVWSASYLGLLPALGILKPATKHPVQRNLLMIGAHVVWGASLARMFSSIQTTLPAEKRHDD